VFVVTSWMGPDLAAILTQHRAPSRFEYKILVAPLSPSPSLGIYYFTLGTFSQIAHLILATPKDSYATTQLQTG
jgi:hypothetical protein